MGRLACALGFPHAAHVTEPPLRRDVARRRVEHVVAVGGDEDGGARVPFDGELDGVSRPSAAQPQRVVGTEARHLASARVDGDLREEERERENRRCDKEDGKSDTNGGKTSRT